MNTPILNVVESLKVILREPIEQYNSGLITKAEFFAKCITALGQEYDSATENGE